MRSGSCTSCRAGLSSSIQGLIPMIESMQSRSQSYVIDRAVPQRVSCGRTALASDSMHESIRDSGTMCNHASPGRLDVEPLHLA
jgi:hypothetical protein